MTSVTCYIVLLFNVFAPSLWPAYGPKHAAINLTQLLFSRTTYCMPFNDQQQWRRTRPCQRRHLTYAVAWRMTAAAARRIDGSVSGENVNQRGVAAVAFNGGLQRGWQPRRRHSRRQRRLTARRRQTSWRHVCGGVTA